MLRLSGRWWANCSRLLSRVSGNRAASRWRSLNGLGENRGMARTDHAGRPVIVVTGLGVVTSLGVGREDNWRKLTAGESGIRKIKGFSTEGLRTRIAGAVDFIPFKDQTVPTRAARMAEIAAEEAIAQ